MEWKRQWKQQIKSASKKEKKRRQKHIDWECSTSIYYYLFLHILQSPPFEHHKKFSITFCECFLRTQQLVLSSWCGWCFFLYCCTLSLLPILLFIIICENEACMCSVFFRVHIGTHLHSCTQSASWWRWSISWRRRKISNKRKDRAERTKNRMCFTHNKFMFCATTTPANNK